MDVTIDIERLLNEFAAENARLSRRALLAEARAAAWETKAGQLQAELAEKSAQQPVEGKVVSE